MVVIQMQIQTTQIQIIQIQIIITTQNIEFCLLSLSKKLGCCDTPKSGNPIAIFFLFCFVFCFYLFFWIGYYYLVVMLHEKHFNLKIFLLNYIIGYDLIYLKVNGINDNYYYLEVVGNNMIDCILFELKMNNLRWFIWICIKWNNKKIYWYLS